MHTADQRNDSSLDNARTAAVQAARMYLVYMYEYSAAAVVHAFL